jgi:guanosine-3',5'-bis(diphosphate) 3'-pyrophosphohydrolase
MKLPKRAMQPTGNTKTVSASHESNLEKWLVKVRDALGKAGFISTASLWMIFAEISLMKRFLCLRRKGELKTLPNGATALDFAFDIHTDIRMQNV